MDHLQQDEVRLMLRRAQLLSVDDSGTQQLLDLSAMKGDRPRKVPRIGQFGLSSTPPAGADFMLLAAGGGSSRAMAIGGEHPDHRPKDTKDGCTVLYDAHGSVVSLVEQNIRIVHATEVRIEAASITLVGRILAGSGVTGGAGITFNPDGSLTVSPVPGQQVYLGGNGSDGAYSPVRTLAGSSSNVLAKS